MSLPQDISELAYEALRETKSKQAHRLVEYLLVNPCAFTHEIARDCAIGNLSSAASYVRPALQKRGLSIVASLPKHRVRNRFGEPSQVHEWRLVRLR
ncbi:hypothetical protein ACNKU3_02915 [Haliea sp. E17]